MKAMVLVATKKIVASTMQHNPVGLPTGMSFYVQICQTSILLNIMSPKFSYAEREH
jgi:hypothetical protein